MIEHIVSSQLNHVPLSILIPTFMRDAVLWNTISDLKPQLRSQDEILIIDQNSPALLPPPELQASWLRLIHLDTPSLTRARNLGIESCKHEIMVFLDDDIVPGKDLLDQIRRLSIEKPNRILTGIVDQEDKPEGVPTPGLVNLKNGDIRTNFSRPILGPVPFFPGCLSVIPKSCLPPVPFFCPAFRGASQGEEIDFALRVQARGVQIEADPSIRIYHLKVVEGGCRSPEFRNRFFLDQVYNQSFFFGRHGELLNLFSFLKRQKGFVEFYSRLPGHKSHSLKIILSAMIHLSTGLWLGISQRKI